MFLPLELIGLLHKFMPFVHGYIVGDTLKPYLEKNKEFIKNDLPLL